MDIVDRCYGDVKEDSDLRRTARFCWDEKTAKHKEWLPVEKAEILSMDTLSIYY